MQFRFILTRVRQTFGQTDCSVLNQRECDMYNSDSRCMNNVFIEHIDCIAKTDLGLVFLLLMYTAQCLLHTSMKYSLVLQLDVYFWHNWWMCLSTQYRTHNWKVHSVFAPPAAIVEVKWAYNEKYYRKLWARQAGARWIIDVCEPHDILNFTISYCHVTSIIHNDIILFDHMSYDSFEIFKA